jgi:septum formation protein
MKINELPVILASGSPRRADMLRAEGARFAVLRPGCDEDIVTALDPEETVLALAFRKNVAAKELLAELDARARAGEELSAEEAEALALSRGDHLLISGDTVVYKDGEIIGKPADADDAFRMLQSLRADVNTVYSGACVALPDGRKLLVSARTDVFFGDYSDGEIRAYVESGEPMDKAGGYAIQGAFGKHIDRIDGPLDNVIGFPMEAVKERLAGTEYAGGASGASKAPAAGTSPADRPGGIR